MSFLFDFFRDSPKEASEAAPANESRPDGASSTAAPPVERGDIVNSLRQHLEAVRRAQGKTFQAADFDPDADLYEKGYVDSLSAAQFLLLAERQFGIKLPDWLLGGRAKSLAALADYIAGELSRRS